MFKRWTLEEEETVQKTQKEIETKTGLTVERLGNWLWISGNFTDYDCSILRGLKCKYSFNKEKWYFNTRKRWNPRPLSMEEIREKYVKIN